MRRPRVSKAQGPINNVMARTALVAPLLSGKVPDWSDSRSADRGPSVHRQADRPTQNLRRSSCHRHRECPAYSRNSGAQRGVARGPGASDGNAEVLGIISRSPTDVQPVLDAIVESAARVCGIDDVVLRLRREGTAMVPRAHFGPYPLAASKSVLMNHGFAGCASMARSTFPTSAQNDFRIRCPSAGLRTFLAVPLRSRGTSLDTGRTSHGSAPLHPAQIKLLETFADQAVIAIENVRLFQELKESLEQQTATSEILGVIASSPTDIAAGVGCGCGSAARTVEATDGHVLRQLDGDISGSSGEVW